MNNTPIADSELVINPDGSIFHLHIHPGQLADKIILVGDPGRARVIATRFDSVLSTAENREFVSATGLYKGKKVTVLSTGIGTDNIDIVMTELDALVNIDFASRLPKESHTSLEIVRLGTSGSLQADLGIDSWLLSEAAVGLDGLMNFYAGRDAVSDLDFEEALCRHIGADAKWARPYVVNADPDIVGRLSRSPRVKVGTTVTAPGFYGPQGRVVRLGLAAPGINERLASFRHNGRRLTNYEMECSAIFGFSRLLGHRAATVCAIIANRPAGLFSKDPAPVISDLITHVLDNI